MADLRTKIGAVELATPVIAASGTYGYGVEYDGLVDWTRVGAVSVKGLSAGPSSGHPAPRMVETPAGMLNAIGLQNIGVDAFVSDKLPRLSELGVRVIANCWGNAVEEYEEVVSKLDGVDGVDALELNLSCPNKKEWGDGTFASTGESTREIVSAVRKRTSKPLWVKLSPNVTDIAESARAAEDGGADALSLINTLKGMAVDVRSRKPLLSNGTGGLSGPAIKPVALYMVHRAAAAVGIPVVGGGGIASGEDAAEFLMVGARAVHVGTASLYDPGAPARIAAELDDVLDGLGEPSVAQFIGTLRGG